MAKRGRKKKRVIPGLRLKPETTRTIFFIFFLVFSIISLISFSQTGTFLTTLNSFLVSQFGLISVFVPFILLLIAFVFAKIKTPLKELNVSFGSVLMFVSLLGFLKQGNIGLFLATELSSICGNIATFFIFFFLCVVGFVILFDTNIGQIVKFLITTFKLIKKYTVGNKSKEKKANTDKKLFPSDILPSFSEKLSSVKEDPAVVNVAPILKPLSNQPSLPISSPSNQIWEYPPITLFDGTPGAQANRGDINENAQIIEKTLDSFGIRAKVVEVNKSPSVTQYALEVALGTKLTKILSLSNDLAMALSAPGGQIRIEAPIPGRAFVGIEVPNKSLEVVPLRKILESEAMRGAKNKITVPLGLDVAGNAKVADITKMPHVLIAGQTNSGKSVCVNSWICSVLFRASPDEVKMIMVDPKRVELTPYNDIPHLLTPVIVEPEKVISALKWAVSEMERRNKLFSEVNVKNIEGYNNLSGFQSLPYILVIIDELADIMLFSPSEVEDNICRLAQMARASGIHLILATQRPSVNIVTGLIKANIPTRISFAVASLMDSRVILDSPGAEKLLGRGDMLYGASDIPKPLRVQGCYVSEKEITALVNFIKSKKTANYDDSQILGQPVAVPGSKTGSVTVGSSEGHDPMFDQAVKLVQETGKASASLMQRRLKFGYARAARVLDEMEEAGYIGPSNGAKAREIYMQHSTGDNSGEQ